MRALAAYDAALQVRNPRDTPVEYANTIANKANCLRNLPDDPEHPDAGNRARLREAAGLYTEATRIFRSYQELDKAELVERARDELLLELGEGAPSLPSFAADFGVSRVEGG